MFGLPIHPTMGIWVIFIFWLPHGYDFFKHLDAANFVILHFLFSWSEEGITGHMITLSLTF